MAKEPEDQYRDMTVDELRERMEAGETVFSLIRLPEGSDLTWIDARKLEEQLNFARAMLNKVKLNGAHLEEAYIVGAHLQGAELLGAHLEGASLMGAKLEEANLWIAHLQGAELLAAHLERANMEGAHLEGANLVGTQLNEANMERAHLEGANLWKAHLDGANLMGAKLEEAELSESTGFERAAFSNAFVAGMILNNVKVSEYRVWHYLKNQFAWLKWRLAPPRMLFSARVLRRNVGQEDENQNKSEDQKTQELQKPALPVMDLTKINGLDQIVCADSIFKRQLVDMQYLQQWEKKHPFWAFWWWITSECGRNLSLWMVWSFVIAMLFGAVYADWSCPAGLKWAEPVLVQIDPKISVDTGDGLRLAAGSPENRILSWFTPYYFSIVTFTTLGFGDITPLNGWGEFWLAFEVVLGYFMLGGLISILANKLARRSHL